MAGASLLTLLDDIATVLDDVATMTKVAATKTAGVLGDDLALNAQQVSGVRAERELPVVWAVAKGSIRNKLILVPAALVISAFAPWAVAPLLMAGGLFLCFEGVEKLAHAWIASPSGLQAERAALTRAMSEPSVDVVAFERDKIRGAVRTDFILSAEIIVITLGTVAQAPMPMRIAVLAGIAVLMTVGVYGLVAGIVKLDDLGLHLSRRTGSGSAGALVRAAGRGILVAAPWLMKGLSIAGTAAMFLVGGGILLHGLPMLARLGDATARWAGALPGVGPLGAVLAQPLLGALVGIAAGALALAAVTLVRRIRRGR
jgi:predicted DNA repair protein MutK